LAGTGQANVDINRPTTGTDSGFDISTPGSQGTPTKGSANTGNSTTDLAGQVDPEEPTDATQSGPSKGHGRGGDASTSKTSSTRSGLPSPYGMASPFNQSGNIVDKAGWNFSDWASLLPSTVLPTQTNIVIEHSSITAVPGLTTSSVSTQPMDTLAHTQSSVFDRVVKATPVTVETSGLVLSLGSVWWAARGAGLITGLLATTPVWRQIDPLPVMLTPQHEDGPEDPDTVIENEHANRAEALFGEQHHQVEMIG